MTAPMINILPVPGSSGSTDNSRPIGVKISPPDASLGLMAPSLKSLSMAYSTVSSEGGSIAFERKCCTPSCVIEHV